MFEDITSCLMEFGLANKEIVVYLAMLELGPKSVQDIARKAGINRSTTYVMIESLKRRGLVSTFEQKKKTMFVAETPQRLRRMMDEEVVKTRTKRERLDQALPRLLAIFHAIEDKPIVRYVEGEEALMRARQEMVHSREPIWELSAVDEPTVEIAQMGSEARIELSKKVSRSRSLLAIKPGMTPPYFERRGFDVREISYNAYPFSGALVIVGKKVFVFTTKSSGVGVIVESGEIAAIARNLFDAAWKSGKPWTPPAGWGR